MITPWVQHITGQGADVRLSTPERSSHTPHAGHDAFLVFLDLFEDRQAEARHNAHADHNVG